MGLVRPAVGTGRREWADFFVGLEFVLELVVLPVSESSRCASLVVVTLRIGGSDGTAEVGGGPGAGAGRDRSVDPRFALVTAARGVSTAPEYVKPRASGRLVPRENERAMKLLRRSQELELLVFEPEPESEEETAGAEVLVSPDVTSDAEEETEPDVEPVRV